MEAAAQGTISLDAVAQLRAQLSEKARVYLPGDGEDYLRAINAWNKDFTGKPTLAIVLACTQDAVHAIEFVRKHALPFTVGGGFHSRYSLRDGHVLISLGGMRKAALDPQQQVIRVQGGCRNEDLDVECFKYHLHTVAGTNPDTGVGGLILGGGIGYLTRRLGMSIDNLIEVELVTADAQIVRASEQNNAELFWAVRGAGFNFGIITEFTLKVHRVGHQLREKLTPEDEAIAAKYNLPSQDKLEHLMVQGVLPYPQSAASQIARVIDEKYIKPGPNGPMKDRNLFFGFILANGPHGPAAIVQFAHTGDVYEGYRLVDQLVADIGMSPAAPIHATIKPDTYLALQHALDDHTKPGHYYERMFIAEKLSEPLINVCLDSHQQLKDFPCLHESVLGLLILGCGSAMSDNVGKGAFSNLQRQGNVFVTVIGKYDPQDAGRDKAIAWNNKLRESILPHTTTSYTNSSNGQPGSKVIFAGSLDRLREVKRQWDPQNLFRNNQNIVPAGVEVTSADTNFHYAD